MSRQAQASGEGKGMPYPPLSWIREQLRYNCHSWLRTKILEAYIVGSRAKGTAIAKSDLDIALVVPAKKRVSSLRMTENYHANFTEESQKPKWNGIVVDFQFFYPGDPHLAACQKVPIAVKTTQGVINSKETIKPHCPKGAKT